MFVLKNISIKTVLIILFYLGQVLFLRFFDSSVFLLNTSLIVEFVLLLLIYTAFSMFEKSDSAFLLLFMSFFLILFYLFLIFIISSKLQEFQTSRMVEAFYEFKYPIICSSILLGLIYVVRIIEFVKKKCTFMVLQKNIIYHVMYMSMIILSNFILIELFSVRNIIAIGVTISLIRISSEFWLNQKMKEWFVSTT